MGRRARAPSAEVRANGAARSLRVNNLLKTGIAGFAAWKWGGGLVGALLLFVVIYFLLGKV